MKTRTLFLLLVLTLFSTFHAEAQSARRRVSTACERVREVTASDGQKYYETKNPTTNTLGIEMHGRQVVPNYYKNLIYSCGCANGLHYFAAPTGHGVKIYDCEGNQLFWGTKDEYKVELLYADNDILLFRFTGNTYKLGIINGKTGKIVVEPQYSEISNEGNGTIKLKPLALSDKNIKYVTASNIADGNTTGTTNEVFQFQPNCSYKIEGVYSGDGKSLYTKAQLEQINARIEWYSNDLLLICPNSKSMHFYNLSTPNTVTKGTYTLTATEDDELFGPLDWKITIKKINTNQYKFVYDIEALEDTKYAQIIYYIIESSPKPIRNPKY